MEQNTITSPAKLTELPSRSGGAGGGLQDCYRIGRLGKPHGVKGELLFQFDDDVFDRADADFLIIEVDGILVPFFIEEYRFRTDTTAILKLEDIDTQERARELTNSDVYFPRALTPQDEEEELRWSFFVGFDIVDARTTRTVGRIAHVDDQTTNILFELEDGRLIPAAEELITDVDHDRHQITIDLPEGLLDL